MNRLESALDSPVVWVAGPAGSGKTTLVSDFVRSRKRPCIWYQVDERDVDPGTFFHYMGLAVKKAFPENKKHVPDFSPESLSGLMGFTITFFEKIFDTLKKGSLLVLDNYQMMQADAHLHRLMKRALSIIPRGMNIIIISRKSPPKELVGFLADNTMAVLLWEDLKLTLDEARDILVLRSKYHYSKKEVQHLHEITNGWVSGLTLWVHASLFSPSAPVQAAYDTPEEIFDYFASEIFSNTSPEMKHFLMATSFLPKMNISMADEIAGTQNARDILLNLVRQQYFILKYGRLDRFYAYHQLFRSFLQARALDTLTRTELNHYRKKAALLLIKNGDIDEAARQLIECQAFDELAELITTHSLTLIGQGRHALIIEWVSTLPEEIVMKNIWLVYWLGVARLVISPEESYRNFEIAFQFFSESGDVLGKLLSWSGIIDALALQFSNFKGFDKWIQVFDQIKKDYLSISDEEIQCRVASSFFKALVLRQPHHPSVEMWAKLALVRGNDRETLNMRSWTYVRLQFYYLAIKTDTRKLEEIAEELKRIAAAHPYTSPMATINVLYTEMVALQFTGRLQQSLAVLSKYRIVAGKSGIHLFDFFFSMHEASIYLDMNNVGKAARVLKQMQSHEDVMNPWVKSFYYFQKTRLGMMKQDCSGIEEDNSKALALAEEVGCHFTILVCLLQKVYVYQARGLREKAGILLKEYFDRIENRESARDHFMGLLTQAHLFFESGKEKKGLAALRKGLAIGKKHELLFNFSDQPAVTAGLCMKALSENIEVSHVQTIIKKRNLQPEVPPVHLDNWPWPVKIQSFGSFEIYIEGHPIHLSRKSPRKIFKLLKAIIAYPNDKVPAIWLMDSLWPDADGDRAMESLKVSIKRLRKLLGNPQAVQWKKSTVWLNPKLVWVDLIAFESINEEINRQTSDPRSHPFIRSRIDSAVNLVMGPFLEGDDSLPVFISRRSELEILLAHLFQLALTHAKSKRKLVKMITLCNKTVSNPSLSQAIHQKVVAWMSKNGE
ncbi:winged helix-turn-helix domain-containing protein [Desulfospira joergensenii]|uniref:winged helix-turn-helix domain-containing protein n=1 Tax=Desulfospira joergensenii TaxID=53329 RepID=UPI0003B42C31|nr:winged helix-turn-helix domain-containing protein [Desulfospira joergensenii]